MQLVEDPVWRRFWYPVAYAADLRPGPLSRTLLGTPIVVWESAPGRAAAAVDRCPHRDARLSQGWTCDGAVVCPYHGWRFGGDGTAVHIPQTPERTTFPDRYALRTVQCESDGHVVWVCLDDAPLRPRPRMPEAGEGWRWLRQFDEEWAASAPRLMENSFDPAHITFVHRATFGNAADPVIATPQVRRVPEGLVMDSTVEVRNPPEARAASGEVTETTVRTTTTVLHAPFLRVLTISYPAGRVHRLVTCATPVDDGHLQLLQWAVRNDGESDVPAADIVAFDRAVVDEDKELLEGVWAPYDPDLGANVHVRVDRPTVELRRLYREIEAGTWPRGDWVGDSPDDVGLTE